MSEKKRTSIYIYQEDQDRLARLKANHNLGGSEACRRGLALLEQQLDDAQNYILRPITINGKAYWIPTCEEYSAGKGE